MQKVIPASHILMAALLIAVLSLKLVPVAFAGFLVFTLAQKLSSALLSRTAPSERSRWWHYTRVVAVTCVLLAVVALFVATAVASEHFLRGQEGLPWLMAQMADILDKVRFSVPASMQPYVPTNVSEFKTTLVDLLRTHGEAVSSFGVQTLKSGALILLALVAGTMVALTHFGEPHEYRPLAGALLSRFSRLTSAFEKVVFAQVRISLVNTALTAIYLLGVLPQLGVHLPLAHTLVVITFIAGLLPVIGNLISNSIIVTLSLGVSPQLGLASLGFLVAVHKLEYFLNAKIIGHSIDAKAWELILAMIAMEQLFGLAGLVAAPVLYAYLKRELKDAGLIGRNAAPEAPETVPPMSPASDALCATESVSAVPDIPSEEAPLIDAQVVLGTVALEEVPGAPVPPLPETAPVDSITVTAQGEALMPAQVVGGEVEVETGVETLVSANGSEPAGRPQNPWERRRPRAS